MQLKLALIKNAGLKGIKFDLLYNTLIDAAYKNGIGVTLLDNIEARKMLYTAPEYDAVLFWDKDVILARQLEAMGMRLFNSASAIEKCDSKALTYACLMNSGIKMPKTLTSPLVFYTPDLSGTPFVAEAEEVLGYPMILKEAFGSFGFQVYMINDRDELLTKLRELGTKPFVLQEYIASSHGRDIRIEVVGGTPVASMLRYSQTDFRANITSGGSMMPYIPTSEQLKTATDAARALGLDFCGVDILFGENGEPILCEVNSNAHINNISDCTGVDVADAVMKYIKEELS